MEGRISPLVVVLFRMSESFGKVREGLVTGLNERNIGPVVVETFGGPAGPRSNSSQQKVSGSLLGSLPDPVRINGVLLGIVKFAPAFTVGTPLPVAVVTGHVFPVPVVE